MLKTYPSFVNFFEMSKDTIVKCEKLKPRFHAFLKVRDSVGLGSRSHPLDVEKLISDLLFLRNEVLQ